MTKTEAEKFFINAEKGLTATTLAVPSDLYVGTDLSAVEEDGTVYLVDDQGRVRVSMSIEDYNALKEFKSNE